MAALTSPDSVVAATVVIANQEGDGTYPIQITQLTPQGQHVAVEINGVRVYEGNVAAGDGTEG